MPAVRFFNFQNNEGEKWNFLSVLSRQAHPSYQKPFNFNMITVEGKECSRGTSTTRFYLFVKWFIQLISSSFSFDLQRFSRMGSAAEFPCLYNDSCCPEIYWHSPWSWIVCYLREHHYRISKERKLFLGTGK